MSENLIEIKCPNCSTLYNLDSGSIGTKKKVLRCSVCSHKFAIQAKGVKAAEEPPVLPTDASAEEPVVDEAMDMSATVPEAESASDSAFTAGEETIEMPSAIIEEAEEPADFSQFMGDDDSDEAVRRIKEFGRLIVPSLNKYLP